MNIKLCLRQILGQHPRHWPTLWATHARLWRQRKTLKAHRNHYRQQMQGGKWAKDWFTRHIPIWLSAINQPATTRLNILEIGAYEGLCSRFLLWHFTRAQLTCVDTFAGSHEDGPNSPRSTLEKRFDHNLKAFSKRLRKLKGDSRVLVPQLHAEHFNLIYIDGYHHSHYVMVDALNAWQLLKVGGVMIFDDYGWQFADYPPHHRPRGAIDHFLPLIKGDYRLLHVGYQLLLQRVR